MSVINEFNVNPFLSRYYDNLLFPEEKNLKVLSYTRNLRFYGYGFYVKIHSTSVEKKK